MLGMNRSRAPGCVTPRARARAGLTVSLALVLSLAHANPFASPEPPPPPSTEVPLPPEFDVDFPALPTPPLDAPEVEDPLTPEERLEEVLADLERPTLDVQPQVPATASHATPPSTSLRVTPPGILTDPAAHQTALALDTGRALSATLQTQGVTLAGIIHGGTPQAIFEIASVSYVLPYGATLPGQQVRISDVRESSVVLTYQGASVELTLAGGAP